MPERDYDDFESEEVKDELGIYGYRLYIIFNILSTMFTMVLCLCMTAAITWTIYQTGNERLVWLFILPAITYILS